MNNTRLNLSNSVGKQLVFVGSLGYRGKNKSNIPNLLFQDVLCKEGFIKHFYVNRPKNSIWKKTIDLEGSKLKFIGEIIEYTYKNGKNKGKKNYGVKIVELLEVLN